MDKSEALRLADALDVGIYDAAMARTMDKAAAELRRLAAVEAQRDALWAALARISVLDEGGLGDIIARAAIAKAEGKL